MTSSAIIHKLWNRRGPLLHALYPGGTDYSAGVSVGKTGQ